MRSQHTRNRNRERLSQVPQNQEDEQAEIPERRNALSGRVTSGARKKKEKFGGRALIKLGICLFSLVGS